MAKIYTCKHCRDVMNIFHDQQRHLAILNCSFIKTNNEDKFFLICREDDHFFLVFFLVLWRE